MQDQFFNQTYQVHAPLLNNSMTNKSNINRLFCRERHAECLGNDNTTEDFF